MDKLIVGGMIKVPLNKAYDAMKAFIYVKPLYSGGTELVTTYKIEDDYVYFPRNLQKIRRFTSLPFEYQLATPAVSPAEYADWFSLYDYQKVACKQIVQAFKSDINVLFQAGTRFGKTATALGVYNNLKVRTLILVDKNLLANQFKNDWLEYTDWDIDIELLSYGGGDVTISTFQYLNANPALMESIKEDYGLLIVDELHVSAAATYSNIIQKFNVRYRLGMTATPTRTSDRLTEVLHDLFGQVKVVGENPNNMEVYWTSFMLPKAYKASSYNPASSYEKYFLLPEVQEQIVGLALKYKDKTVMLATNSQKVQEHYMQLFNDLGLNTCVFNSASHNKKAEEENLRKVADGDITMFSGLNVLLKGVSIPRLEVIINLFSVSSPENVTQLVGRLKTKHPDKTKPLFINCKPKFGDYKSDKVESILAELDGTTYIDG